MNKLIPFLTAILLITSCDDREEVDMMLHNAHIYTVDTAFSQQEAMLIDQGRIIAVGDATDLEQEYSPKEKKDMKGKFIYPGLIDAHAHLYGLGMNLRGVDLRGTNSYEDVVQRVVEYQQKNEKDFIIGRSWDQNDWKDTSYPVNDTLNQLFPDTPVVLTRVDGHAMLVNDKALTLADIDKDTEASGGEILKREGELTGVLIDNPMKRIEAIIPAPTEEEIRSSLQKAERIAFENGLTSVVDAGLSRKVIEIIEQMHQEEALKIRMYAMVRNNESDIDHFFERGIIDQPRLSVRSVKVYADGALGSRGAVLQEPYSDQPGHYGKMVISVDEFRALAKEIASSNYQMNTHAIGDSANAVVFRTYDKLLKDRPDRRWRVEHAQVLDPSLYDYFSKNIIPSVQPTHATSDMYWAEDRLGEKRIEHAYAYKRLLSEAEILALGTDFPVEKVNPLLTFYAAVSRQDTKGYPDEGFQSQNAITRKQALKGMTIWAAYANFEEDKKGSLEPGKFADFVVLDKDIMNIPMDEIPSLKVKATYVNGEEVYAQ